MQHFFMFKRKVIYTNKELLSLIQQGSTDKVLSYLYKSVQPKITSWVLQNSGSKEEAQDIFQDSVIVFYKYVVNKQFKVTESIEGFIFVTAKNKWINRAKQQQRTKGLSEEFNHIKEEEVREEKNIHVEALLEKLGEVCKELLTYSIFYKMSMEDIALRMNYSGANAVKTKNYKCKQRLVKLVKDKKGLRKYLDSE